MITVWGLKGWSGSLWDGLSQEKIMKITILVGVRGCRVLGLRGLGGVGSVA